MFYWINDIKPEDIEAMLLSAIECPNAKTDIHITAEIIHVAAVLGKNIHSKLLKKAAKSSRLLNNRTKNYPANDPRKEYFGTERMETLKRSWGDLPQGEATDKLESELESAVRMAIEGNIDFDNNSRRWRTVSLDCFLYSQNYR